MENRKTAKKLTPKANEIVRVVRDMSDTVGLLWAVNRL